MKRLRLFSMLPVMLLMLFLWLPVSVNADDVVAILYVRVPADWTAPHVWAWDSAGNNAFLAWPGGVLEADPNNPGWFYIHLPVGMHNIVINDDGGTQTFDLRVNTMPAWVTVLSENDVDISYEPLTAGDFPLYIPRFTVYVRTPDHWIDPIITSWNRPAGAGAFMARPGLPLRRVGDWYTARIPYWADHVVITNHDGTEQTRNTAIQPTIGQPTTVWLLIDDDANVHVYYENPDFMAPLIYIRAQVPEGWEAPHLWAWLHPDGTNLFASWPGEPMTRDGDGYIMQIRGWVNSLIINANNGMVQTGDMHDVEIGRDVWILVLDADNFGFDYYEISELPATQDDVTDEVTHINDETEPLPPIDDANGQNNGRNNSLLMTILIGAGAIVFILVASLFIKKK
ncbi:MAG: starch-binding protein [Defluviitaleaceae bacterium]|nr:starch-binding protein [Defluviitaleaceae bacterium]